MVRRSRCLICCTDALSPDLMISRLPTQRVHPPGVPYSPRTTRFYNAVPIVGLILADHFKSKTSQVAGSAGQRVRSWLETRQHEVNISWTGPAVNQSKMYWSRANQVLALWLVRHFDDSDDQARGLKDLRQLRIFQVNADSQQWPSIQSSRNSEY